jgi:transposase
MKTYILNPNMTFRTLTTPSAPHKPANRATEELVNALLPEALKAKLSRPDPLAPTPPAPRALPPRQPLPRAKVDAAKPRLQLGLDVHLEFIMAVVQRGHASLQAPRHLTRAQLVEQIRRWVAEGLQVFCVQESCGFGFVLHRELVAAGAQSFLITPVALNGKRKTDKLDARALCLRLSRWLDGNTDELAPIRIPSEAEQRRRDGTRRRKFLGRAIRRLGNHGHGQVAEYCHAPLPSRWWGARNWKKLSTLDPWVLGLLTQLREVILVLEAQLETVEAELVARVQGQERPKGLGEITLVTLDGEICDWGRFYNRKQIGSYTGCCPGEHTSAGKRRLGSIDRMGNGRVRSLLVEAVWRFLQWQPQWKAAARMKVKLAAGTALRKKTVVALARLLAIDLWRWRTGRATLADLGWVAA